jgi:hypothetical protein
MVKATFAYLNLTKVLLVNYGRIWFIKSAPVVAEAVAVVVDPAAAVARAADVRLPEANQVRRHVAADPQESAPGEKKASH